MLFSHSYERHKKNKRFNRKKKDEWGNTNVDNSIYIVRAKCQLSHFENCPTWRLFAENVHNSIETWLRLRPLPLSHHPSQEYFMCHHLPTMESKAKVMSVSCPGDSLQQPRLFSRSRSLYWWAQFALPGPRFCNFARLHYWQNIEFEPFKLVLISMTNLMMDNVVDLNGFLSIKHDTECSHNRPF